MLLGNLVGNAVKYNRPGGSVSIRARSHEGRVTLEVSDTGIGIPQECMPHLFEEFYRVKSERTKEIPGTGLGLVICRRIVDDIGGSIEVSSEEDRGTTVIVHLPEAERRAVGSSRPE